MDIIDIVKEFEIVGFTRKQAEQQVKTMVDLKKDLMTKQDGIQLKNELKQDLTGKINGVKQGLIALSDRLERTEKSLSDKIDAQNTKFDGKFDAINTKFDAVLIKLDAMNDRISFMPFKTVVYGSGVLLTYFALSGYWPTIEKWFIK